MCEVCVLLSGGVVCVCWWTNTHEQVSSALLLVLDWLQCSRARFCWTQGLPDSSICNSKPTGRWRRARSQRGVWGWHTLNIYIKQKDLKTHLQSFHGGSHQTIFLFSLKIYIPLTKQHIIIFSLRLSVEVKRSSCDRTGEANSEQFILLIAASLTISY